MASGPIESVTINRRRFTVDGEVDAAIALSGFMNEMKTNGDGTNRLVKSRKTGRINALPIVIDNDRDDEKFIQDTLDLKTVFPFSVTLVTGDVFSGDGQIVEDPETSAKEGTKEVSYAGTLRKQ